ncbi:MAG: NAD-dependent epimerase/dehydratase family protein [Candidatus Aminicenantales bacterium]
MKAFVTGGTGFIGSHLVEHLIYHKHAEVFALVRDPAHLKWLGGLDVHPLTGDLFTLPPLPKDLDCVIHAAGLTKAFKSAAYYTVNHQGTASLFQVLEAQGIAPSRVIHLSSLAASGPSSYGKPVKEDDPPHPLNAYGKSKLLAEQEALKFKDRLKLVIVRPGGVYGPRDKDFLSYFRIINRGILPSLASQKRWLSLCYVKDLIQAIDLCLQNDLPSGEIINIADPQPYTWDEIGIEAGKTLDKKLRRVKIPFTLLRSAAVLSEAMGRLGKHPPAFNRQKLKEMEQPGWVADITKARTLLRFSPRYSLAEGLRETLGWYRDRGWM